MKLDFKDHKGHPARMAARGRQVPRGKWEPWENRARKEGLDSLGLTVLMESLEHRVTEVNFDFFWHRCD